ncbi:MAG: arylesterase [Acidobacteriota bacterium]
MPDYPAALPSRPRVASSFYSALSVLLVGLLTVFAAGCSSEEPAPPPAPEPAPREPLPDPGEPPGGDITVVFLGDSLTAGYGVDEDEGFPMRVERQLHEEGASVRVINGGVSGDTTAGGLRRLSWLLRQDPDILMVALGGNDGLRGLDLDDSEANLRLIIEQAQAADVRVLLAGMLMPPNYGEDYTERFAAIYPRLAEDYDVALIPFLLEGVAGDPELNQPDGIHPTADGQKIVSEVVLTHLRPLLSVAEEEMAAEAPTDVLP